MAALRKMLGRLEDPSILALQEMIPTQSKTTLSAWAMTYTEDHFLSIYEKSYPDDSRLRDLLTSGRAYLAGEMKLAAWKAALREGRKIPQQAEDPAAQAAARAVTTACAVTQTPTNALGFTFYGAAALAYDQAGLTASCAVYDQLAEAALRDMADSCRAILVPNEENPVKIDWNC